MNGACSFLRHQGPLLTAVFFSFLYLSISMSCQCHFRHVSYFMLSLHLHYHHHTQPMGISYLDSPMVTFQVVYLGIPATVIFLKIQRWSYSLPVCVWDHSVTFSCTREAKFLAWLRGGPKALHGLILLHFPPWSLYSSIPTFSVPKKCFLMSLALCIYCLFVFLNVGHYSQPLNSHIRSHYKREIIFHIVSFRQICCCCCCCCTILWN